MTAPALTSSSEFLPVGSLLSHHGHSVHKTHLSKPTAQSMPRSPRELAPLQQQADMVDLGSVWSRLLELLPQGVVVVSRDLQPVYWNQKARNLCQGLLGAGFSETTLPHAIAEACHRFIREQPLLLNPLILEYQTSSGTVRISVRWLELAEPCPENSAKSRMSLRTGLQSPQPKSEDAPAFISVFLENCDEILQEEIRIQRKKYDLTEREAEVLRLLRQEYTYQEIAQALQISLNTVKTHVKNIYAKRRSCQGTEKFWCYDE